MGHYFTKVNICIRKKEILLTYSICIQRLYIHLSFGMNQLFRFWFVCMYNHTLICCQKTLVAASWLLQSLVTSASLRQCGPELFPQLDDSPRVRSSQLLLSHWMRHQTAKLSLLRCLEKQVLGSLWVSAVHIISCRSLHIVKYINQSNVLGHIIIWLETHVLGDLAWIP